MNGIVVLASILAVVGMLAVFANRLLFNPDNFASTSTQMLQNAAIRTATANYLVDQLYANVNVSAAIQSGLPPQLESLAGPTAGALRSAAPQVVNVALTRPRVQSLWEKANRAADRTFIDIVNGGTGAVRVNNGAVTLNLGSILGDGASRLGLPSSITSKIPPTVANLTILKSNQLSLIQDIGKGIQGLALALTIVVPLLYALAVALARGHRRRTLMSVGFAGITVGLLGLGARALLVTQVPNSLIKDVAIRPAGRAVVDIVTQIRRWGLRCCAVKPPSSSVPSRRRQRTREMAARARSRRVLRHRDRLSVGRPCPLARHRPAVSARYAVPHAPRREHVPPASPGTRLTAHFTADPAGLGSRTRPDAVSISGPVAATLGARTR